MNKKAEISMGLIIGILAVVGLILFMSQKDEFISTEPDTMQGYLERLQNSTHLSYLLPCEIEPISIMNKEGAMVCEWVVRAEFFIRERISGPNGVFTCSELLEEMNIQPTRTIKGREIYDDEPLNMIVFCTENDFMTTIKAETTLREQVLSDYFEEFFVLIPT